MIGYWFIVGGCICIMFALYGMGLWKGDKK